MNATGTVVEELTLAIESSRRAAFLRRDAQVWTPFLEGCDGFLGKEAWLPVDRPNTIVLVIRWASMEQWKSITPEQVAAVDEGMGDLVPDNLECRAYQVV